MPAWSPPSSSPSSSSPSSPRYSQSRARSAGRRNGKRCNRYSTAFFCLPLRNPSQNRPRRARRNLRLPSLRQYRVARALGGSTACLDRPLRRTWLHGCWASVISVREVGLKVRISMSSVGEADLRKGEATRLTLDRHRHLFRVRSRTSLRPSSSSSRWRARLGSTRSVAPLRSLSRASFAKPKVAHEEPSLQSQLDRVSCQ